VQNVLLGHIESLQLNGSIVSIQEQGEKNKRKENTDHTNDNSTYALIAMIDNNIQLFFWSHKMFDD
jgi:hypothetical protein